MHISINNGEPIRVTANPGGIARISLPMADRLIKDLQREVAAAISREVLKENRQQPGYDAPPPDTTPSFTVCDGCGALLADAGIDRCPSCMHPL